MLFILQFSLKDTFIVHTLLIIADIQEFKTLALRLLSVPVFKAEKVLSSIMIIVWNAQKE